MCNLYIEKFSCRALRVYIELLFIPSCVCVCLFRQTKWESVMLLIVHLEASILYHTFFFLVFNFITLLTGIWIILSIPEIELYILSTQQCGMFHMEYYNILISSAQVFCLEFHISYNYSPKKRKKKNNFVEMEEELYERDRWLNRNMLVHV